MILNNLKVLSPKLLKHLIKKQSNMLKNDSCMSKTLELQTPKILNLNVIPTFKFYIFSHILVKDALPRTTRC